ncbi:YceD family protein [Sulfurospirillum sp. 1307]|jgi:uncharacterized metal-binding protein YceD (DUF177 family)
MVVAFNKISTSGIDFKATIDGVEFTGFAKKDSNNLVHCNGKLVGTLTHICDRCGNEFDLKIDEKVDLFASDGEYNGEDYALDVMEFFEGLVNFDTILESELGVVLSDYHYCSTCKENI